MNKKIAVMLAGILSVSVLSVGCAAPAVEDVEPAPVPEAPPVEETVDVPAPAEEEELDVPTSEEAKAEEPETPVIEEETGEMVKPDAGTEAGDFPFTEEEIAAMPEDVQQIARENLELARGQVTWTTPYEEIPGIPEEEPVVETPAEKTDAEVQQTLNEICVYIKNNIDTTSMSENAIAHIDDNLEIIKNSLNEEEFNTWIVGYKCGSWTREELEYSFEAWVEGGGAYSTAEFYAW